MKKNQQILSTMWTDLVLIVQRKFKIKKKTTNPVHFLIFQTERLTFTMVPLLLYSHLKYSLSMPIQLA